MKKNGRKLDRKAQEAIRLMAVERVREGEAPSDVIASYGMNRTTIHKWLGRSKGKGAGLRALKARKGSGRPRKLDAKQERQVFRWVNGKNPNQYGFDFGLWTRNIVRSLIEEKYGARLSLASVGALLARLNLTAQKPLQRAYQRDPEAIERWQRESFPAIASKAKRQGAQIFFWDESGFRADSVHGKTWGVRGQTPVVRRPGQRQSISAASAVNARGGFWFQTYKGALSGELFVELLKRMMRHRKKSVHLIIDGLPAHKKALVRDYIKSTRGRLTLHFLPGYAPDLNPDELVWSHIKRTGTARRPLQAGERLDKRIDAQLAAVQRNPKLVRSFFGAPSVAYITDR